MNDQPLKGALLLVLGEGLLAVMAAMIKMLSDHLDTEVIVFARNLFGLMFLLPIIMHAWHSCVRRHKSAGERLMLTRT